MKRSNFLVNMNIRQKLTVTLLPVVFAFIATNSYIFFSMNNTMKASIVQENVETAKKIENDINTNLVYLNEESIKMLLDADVADYLHFRGSAEEEAMVKSRFLRTVSGKNTITGSMVRSVFLMKTPTNYAYYSSSWGMDTREMNRFAASMMKRHRTLRKAVYQTPSDEFFEQCGVLHYIYPISNAAEGAGDSGALMVINLNPLFLANIFARYYYSDALFSITDEQGHTIFQMTDAQSGDREEAAGAKAGEAGESGVSRSGKGDRAVLTVRRKMDAPGWTISIRVPYATAFREINNYRTVFFITSVLSVLVSAVFISMASSTVVSRIREMTDVMAQVKEGKLDCRYPVRYRDEISVIGSEMNHMIESIQYLRFDLTERELRQREAEMIALQSQINPHFLYNTLETIRMIAIGNDDPQTAQITKTLSDLLRYTIKSDDGEALVTVAQEIEHVQAYLSIQKLRFGDRFRVEWEMEEAVLPQKTIQLILQPLVENVFSHGIKEVERDGVIVIRGAVAEEKVTLTVSDNGRGMDAERLLELHRLLRQPPFQVKGMRMIGLANVNNRIKLCYGERYGVEIESRPGYGTTATVVLPLTTAEEEGKNDAAGFIGR